MFFYFLTHLDTKSILYQVKHNIIVNWNRTVNFETDMPSITFYNVEYRQIFIKLSIPFPMSQG